MNAALRAPVLLPTLTPVPPTMDCTRCDGRGEVPHPRDEWKHANDPSKRVVVCPECDDGQAPDPNFDPNEPAWYCGCGTPLTIGDDCSRCGAAPTEDDA